MFGPARMSPEVVKRLHDAVAPMLTNPAMKEKLAQQAMTPWPASGQELAALLVEERKRFEQLVKASGYQREDA